MRIQATCLLIVMLFTALSVGCRAETGGAVMSEKNAWIKSVLQEGTGRDNVTVEATDNFNGGVEAIIAFHYPDVFGKDAIARAKVYLPETLKDNPQLQLPYLHVAGYEADRNSGETICRNGFIASTPTGEEPNPLVRGENIDIAILHRIRKLACIKDDRVAIMGGSAGGYMTLMTSAETFPLMMSMPDCPPINVGYNCAYIVGNKPYAEEQPAGQDHVNMPVLLAVAGIGEGARDLLGDQYESMTYWNDSPIVRMQEVTCPTVITIATADILVPIDQYGEDLIRPYDPAIFPEGFKIHYDQVLTNPAVKKRLVDVVPTEDIDIHVLPVPEDAPAIGWDGAPGPGEVPQAIIPFSKTKRFTLIVMDDGKPEPQSSHVKRVMNLNKDGFIQYYTSQPIKPEQLSAAKLERLMKRYQHIEAYPQHVTRNGVEMPLNRLDYPEVEKADVLRSLKTFAADPACAAQLHEIYKALPSDLQALGADFAAGSVDEMKQKLVTLKN